MLPSTLAEKQLASAPCITVTWSVIFMLQVYFRSTYACKYTHVCWAMNTVNLTSKIKGFWLVCTTVKLEAIVVFRILFYSGHYKQHFFYIDKTLNCVTVMYNIIAKVLINPFYNLVFRACCTALKWPTNISCKFKLALCFPFPTICLEFYLTSNLFGIMTMFVERIVWNVLKWNLIK